MQDQKKICLAVLEIIDHRGSAGCWNRSFTNKEEFNAFVQQNHGRIYSGNTLVIFSGGSHRTISINAAMEMEWIMETV